MIAALQQIPVLWGVNEKIDKTEGGGVINSHLDECRKSHPTRQQKMKKKKRKGISYWLTKHQVCIWIVRIWEITTIASIRTTSGACIIHEVRISYSESCVCKGAWTLWRRRVISSPAIFSLGRRLKNNNQILRSATSLALLSLFLLISVLHETGCWHGEGDRNKQTVFGWRHSGRDDRTRANVYSSWEWKTPLTLQRI